MTRTTPTAADIARDARRTLMNGLIDRLTRRAKLSDAELLLLRAQWEIETTEAELAERARRGLDRQREQMTARLRAAEDTIREVEAERDATRAELATARQTSRALTPMATWPEWLLTNFDITGAFCGTCGTWIPGSPGQPHNCPAPPTTTKEN
ncbi:hypothetical protein [Streptomyces omiyaensis]|uniref:hypothetical protein n=1 Tax=Streptomyces omiyaensis TaxID=68247 RepID=UPI003700CF51